MKVDLCHRHHGIHRTLKTVEVTGKLEEYWTATETSNPGNGRFEKETVNEHGILLNLPEDFLPVEPKKCLLVVEDVNKEGERVGSHAPDCYLRIFQNWGKYFDSYIICLRRD